MTAIKPLNWVPTAGIGYTVVRRADGGMHFIFTSADAATLTHWRDFAMQHLYDSDRLTRNLYDLRALADFPEEAIRFALEPTNDPAARNLRVAAVVANDAVKTAVERIAALTPPTGVDLRVFTDLEKAEAWLAQPLERVI
ncbi:MAG: hypothetical protein ACOYYS_03175 [Chloroflexota bacterium]